MDGVVPSRFSPVPTWSKLAWVEVLVGWWIRKRQKHGGWLAIVSLPVWMLFPIVFLLPIWIALGPIRVALAHAGWRALR